MSLTAYFEKIPIFRNFVLPLIASPVRRRLASGAFWGGVAGVGTKGLTIIASFFLARLLGQEGLGEYGVINNTAGMIGSMAGFGIGATITKYVAEFKGKDPERAGRILALSMGVTFILTFSYGAMFVVLAPWLAKCTLAAPHLAPMLQISALTVAMGVVNGVQMCSLAGCESFKASTWSMVVCTVIQTLAVVFGAWKWHLHGAVCALAMSMVVTIIVTRWVVAKEWKRFGIRLNWNKAWTEWQVLSQYSIPTFLGTMMVGPITWGCVALLANQPGGYAQLGIYHATNQWQTAIQFLPGLIGTATLPVMAERYGDRDVNGSVRVMKGMMGVIAIIVIPITCVVCFFGRWIMKGYGDVFLSGTTTLYLSVMTAALLAIMTPVGQFLAASGKMWTAFLMNMGWGSSMCLLSWFFVKWGAEGLAGARLIAYLIHAVWTLGFIVIIQKKGHSLK